MNKPSDLSAEVLHVDIEAIKCCTLIKDDEYPVRALTLEATRWRLRAHEARDNKSLSISHGWPCTVIKRLHRLRPGVNNMMHAMTIHGVIF